MVAVNPSKKDDSNYELALGTLAEIDPVSGKATCIGPAAAIKDKNSGEIKGVVAVPLLDEHNLAELKLPKIPHPEDEHSSENKPGPSSSVGYSPKYASNFDRIFRREGNTN